MTNTIAKMFTRKRWILSIFFLMSIIFSAAYVKSSEEIASIKFILRKEACLNMAKYWRSNENYEKSFSYLRKAISMTSYNDSEGFVYAVRKYSFYFLEYLQNEQMGYSKDKILPFLSEIESYSTIDEKVLIDNSVCDILDIYFGSLQFDAENEAVNILLQHLSLFGNSAFNHFLSGQLYLFKNNLIKAREEYMAILAMNPRSPAAYSGLKSINIRENNPLEALKCFITVKEIAGEMDFPVVSEDLFKIYGQFKQTVTVEGIDVLFETVRQLAPHYVNIFYCALGEIYIEKMMLEKAKESFLNAIEIQPELLKPIHSDWPYIGLGRVYSEIKHYKIAEKYFKEALRMNGSSPMALIEIGKFYFNNKRIRESERFYIKALYQFIRYGRSEDVGEAILWLVRRLKLIAVMNGDNSKAMRYEAMSIVCQDKINNHQAFLRLKKLLK